MATADDTLYLDRFLLKYNRLFQDAWRLTRRTPWKGFFWLRTIIRQKKMGARRRKAQREGIAVPPVLIFSVTKRCNLRCKGCYSACKSESKYNELSMERVRMLFREASGLGVGVIMIAGGEPLLKPEILWAASEHREIIFPVFTNGMLLNDGSIAYFRNNRNLIPVLSIEGDRHFTDNRRGEGVHATQMRNLRAMKSSRLLYGLSITLTSENYEQVTDPDWISRFTGEACRLFFLVEYVPQSDNDLHLCLTREQKASLQPRLESIRSRIPALLISLPGDEEQYGGCLAAGRGFLHISPTGDLEPCPFAPYADINLSEQSLKASLSSPFLRAIRNSHHRLQETTGGCTLWENRLWVEQLLQSYNSSVSSISL